MLLENLAALKNYFQQNRGVVNDIQQFDAWIDEAKRLFLIKSLADHDGVKYVIEIFQNDVELINQKLLENDSKTLPDYERDRLLDRRELAKKYLDLFASVDTRIDEIEEAVDRNMTNMVLH